MAKLDPAYSQALAARQQLVERTLATAHNLAMRSRDPEAVKVAQFLSSRHISGLPLRDNQLAIDGGRRDPRPMVVLVPVTSIDRLLLAHDDNAAPFATVMRTGNVWASYYRSQRAIYWAADWQLSPLWQGVILLHEGLHAYQHLAMPNAPRARRAREDAAQQLEYRILMAIGGPRLRRLVDTLAANSSAKNRSGETQEQTAHTLDTIFGQPTSAEDDATRATFVETCLRLTRASNGARSRT